MDVPADPVCSIEFWFDDGTIVLQVEDTLYRVYRGLLAARSTVFLDTFSIPQPAEERTEIGGCPVVRLHDKAPDFTHFLRALHQYGSFPNCPVTGFAELNAILRLSDKYDVPALRDSMLSILSSLYPSSLQNWSNPTPLEGYTSHSYDHISALNLTIKMDIRSVLPAIMYAICKLFDTQQILYGTKSRKIEEKLYRDRCVAAIPQLTLAEQNILNYLLLESSDACDDGPVCNEERLRWLKLEVEDTESYSPPNPLLNSNSDCWENLGLCSAYHEAAKVSYNERRQKLWEALPRIFQLGTWDDLS
ncbi:hypothetical protein C8R47DRAFT_961916 [Mycena vitilis]|nr:hypothetical protein C8R47DRAFT_961916 [Mycena vitilis]